LPPLRYQGNTPSAAFAVKEEKEDYKGDFYKLPRRGKFSIYLPAGFEHR